MFKIMIFFKLIMLLCFYNSACSATELRWEMIGPGDADQVTSLSVHNDGAVFAGTDVGGVYVSLDYGVTWQDRNTNLNNYDITTAVIQNVGDPDILYVGTRGGLYKSYDHGVTWKNIRAGLPAINKYSLSGSIGSIAINPRNSKNIILGFGYRPSGDGTKTVRNLKWSNAIYESFDRGETWRSTKVFSTPTKVYQLKFSKNKVDEIYAATSTGVYRGSTSGGLWQNLLEKNCYNILSYEDRPEQMLTACGDYGVYLTEDGGKRWVLSNNGLSFGMLQKKQRYSVLEAGVGDTDTVYLINSSWSSSGGLYKSNDRGKSWNKISRDMPESWLSSSNKMNAIAIDPDNSKHLYLGSSRYLYKSEDEGQSWAQLISQKIADGWVHRGINVFGHTRDIVVDSTDKNHIFMATADHGLLASADAGRSWKNVTDGLSHSTHVLDVDQCIEDPRVFYWVGTNLKGNSCLYKNSIRGDNWLAMCQTWPGKVSATAVLSNPVDCNTVYVATDNKILMTSNSGRTWARLGAGLSSGRVFTLSTSADGKVMYAGMEKGLFVSKDKGKTWQRLKSLMNNTVVNVLLSRTDPNFLLIGTEAGKNKQGGIFLSHDGGKTVENVLKIRKLVSGIVQHPVNATVFFASTNDHNYHDISSGSGIYYSTNAGKSWKLINDGLSVKRAWNISVSPVSYKLYLSANGSGGYMLDLNKFDAFIK